MANEESVELQRLRPKVRGRVYDLVQRAGVDVSPWAIDQDGNVIDPATNMYRSSQWSFGGGSEPLVLCIWWRGLSDDGAQIVHVGNLKRFYSNMLNEIARPDRTASEKQRLRGKIVKAQAVEARISEAYRKRKPLRLILLEGRPTDEDHAAEESSLTDARELDDKPWYAHTFDPFSGEYRLVRDLPLAQAAKPDPFEGQYDPADDTELRNLWESGAITETEREALGKLRLGQGRFRAQLIARWGGCSVTGCKDTAVLIASHILPWSFCATKNDRLSPDNGLLLTPNLDRLFDRGLISFDERYRIVLSAKLPNATANAMNVHPGLSLVRREFAGMLPYLEEHRARIFQR